MSKLVELSSKELENVVGGEEAGAWETFKAVNKDLFWCDSAEASEEAEGQNRVKAYFANKKNRLVEDFTNGTTVAKVSTVAGVSTEFAAFAAVVASSVFGVKKLVNYFKK